MAKKKGLNAYYITRDSLRDAIINQLCKTYNVQYGLVLYNAIMFNPIEMAISILALKLGVNKILVSLIIAFLI
jgi:hypothetical protein